EIVEHDNRPPTIAEKENQKKIDDKNNKYIQALVSNQAQKSIENAKIEEEKLNKKVAFLQKCSQEFQVHGEAQRFQLCIENSKNIDSKVRLPSSSNSCINNCEHNNTNQQVKCHSICSSGSISQKQNCVFKCQNEAQFNLKQCISVC